MVDCYWKLISRSVFHRRTTLYLRFFTKCGMMWMKNGKMCQKSSVAIDIFSLSEGVVTTYIVQNGWNLVPRSEFHRGTTLFLWILAKSLISLVKNGQMCRKSYLADEFSPYWVSLWPHTLTYMYQIWPRCSTDVGQQLVLMSFLPWGPFSGVKWAKKAKNGKNRPKNA